MSSARLADTLIARCHTPWRACIEQGFVLQLARGELPAECFEHYLRQAGNAVPVDRLEPTRLARMTQTFGAATRLEIDVWPMGLDRH